MSNHTDKELLEPAAKAAGLIDYEYVEETDFTHASMQRRNMGGPEDGFFELQADAWSPLTDDGDALRLAVKLQLDFYVDGKQAGCWIDDFVCLIEDINGDPYAATRRAIVRAAAAIGGKL